MQVEYVAQIVLNATRQCDRNLREKANTTPVFEHVDIVPIHQGVKEYIQNVESNPVDIVGLSTGYPRFDIQIGGGLRNGTITLLGARTGFGKSLFSVNVGVYVASKLQIPVLYLDQGDSSEPFIDYVGTSAANASNSISTWTTGNSIQGFIQIDINGTQYWMPYYDAPTS